MRASPENFTVTITTSTHMQTHARTHARTHTDGGGRGTNTAVEKKEFKSFLCVTSQQPVVYLEGVGVSSLQICQHHVCGGGRNLILFLRILHTHTHREAFLRNKFQQTSRTNEQVITILCSNTGTQHLMRNKTPLCMNCVQHEQWASQTH